MKAIDRTGKLSRLYMAAALLMLAESCSEPVTRAPAPTPAPRPAVSIPPPDAVAKPAADWRDAPITPGDWRWAMEQDKSTARFDGERLVLQCDREGSVVRLFRAGQVAGERLLFTVTTAAGTRALNGSAVAGPTTGAGVAIAAGDRLLDGMAFSRGRFVVETEGMPPLYVPSWAEVSRVIEDCR